MSAQATLQYASQHISNVTSSLEGLAQRAAAHRKKFLFAISQLRQFADHFLLSSTPSMLTMPQYESYKYVITEACQQYLELLQQYSAQCWAQTSLENDISSVPVVICNITSTLQEKTQVLDLEASKYFDPTSPQWIQLHLLDLKGIEASFNQYVQSGNTTSIILGYANLRLASIHDFIAQYKEQDSMIHGLSVFSPIPVYYQNWRIMHDDLYEEKMIGSGASAVVSAGIYKPTGEKVAIKKLTCKKLDGLPLQQFQRELSIMATAQHECLLRFIGATEIYPYCIITQWMPGGSLYDDLHQSHNLDATDLTIAAFDIARGMQFLHSQSIVHRDLKSLNVLIDGNKRAKICDFGFSRVDEQDGLMTMHVGTPHWMAPELLQDKSNYDSKVDVYAYAIVLFEIVSKEIPYNGLSATQIIAHVLVNDLRPQLPALPSGISNLIQQCWTKDPNQRPTFAQILRSFRNGNIYLDGCDINKVNQYINAALQNEVSDQVAQTLSTMDSGATSLNDLIEMMERGCLEEDLETCWQMLMKFKESSSFIRGLTVFLNTSYALKASEELKTRDIDHETAILIADMIPTGHEQVDGNLVLAACRNGCVAQAALRVVSPLHIKLVLEVIAQVGVEQNYLESISQIALSALSSTDSSTVVSAMKCLISLKVIHKVPFDTIRAHMESGNISLRTAAYVAAAAMASSGVQIPTKLLYSLAATSGSDPFAAAIIISASKSIECSSIMLDLIISGQRFSPEVSLKIMSQATGHSTLFPKIKEALKNISLIGAKPEFKRAAEAILTAIS